MQLIPIFRNGSSGKRDAVSCIKQFGKLLIAIGGAFVFGGNAIYKQLLYSISAYARRARSCK